MHLNCAFVGLGMGRNHATLMRDTGRMTVTACADPDDSRLPQIREIFPDIRYYRSQAELLAAEKLDVVANATPHFLHAPLVIEALQAGVNVVVEKPMATTHADCQAMIAAARSAGKTLTVYHNRRLDPWFLAVRELIRSGRLGTVFEYHSGIGYGRSSTTWRGEQRASGGVMFDWGAHLVDYLLGLEESPVERVAGWFYREPGKEERFNHDHGCLRLYFASGATGNVTVSHRDFASMDRFRLLGLQGSYRDTWDWKAEGQGTLYTPHPTDRYGKVEEPVPYAKPPAEFYQLLAGHLLDGQPLFVTPESAARNILILETAQRSHEAGNIPLPLPEA